MSPNERPLFEDTFKALTGKASFPWQQELFKRFVAGDWPDPSRFPPALASGLTDLVRVT